MTSALDFLLTSPFSLSHGETDNIVNCSMVALNIKGPTIPTYSMWHNHSATSHMLALTAMYDLQYKRTNRK